MKKKHFTLSAYVMFFVLASCIVSATAGNEPSPWDVKLPFKSAIIEYRINGMENGRQTTYIKDYGRQRADYRTTAMTVMGMTNTVKNIQITTPDWIYSIDLSAGTGTKSANPVKYMKEEFEKLSASDRKKVIKNAERMGTTMMNGMQGEVQKNAAEFLGRKCDVMTMPGMKLYMLAGTDIPLKSETNIMGMNSVTEAVKFKETAVPDDKFEPPPGVQIEYDRESDDIARQTAHNMIKSLVEGKPVEMQGMVRPSGSAPEAVSAPPPAASGHGAPAGHGQGAPPDINELMKQLKGLTGQ